jgi:hypothetical protein
MRETLRKFRALNLETMTDDQLVDFLDTLVVDCDALCKSANSKRESEADASNRVVSALENGLGEEKFTPADYEKFAGVSERYNQYAERTGLNAEEGKVKRNSERINNTAGRSPDDPLYGRSHEDLHNQRRAYLLQLGNGIYTRSLFFTSDEEPRIAAQPRTFAWASFGALLFAALVVALLFAPIPGSPFLGMVLWTKLTSIGGAALVGGSFGAGARSLFTYERPVLLKLTPEPSKRESGFMPLSPPRVGTYVAAMHKSLVGTPVGVPARFESQADAMPQTIPQPPHSTNSNSGSPRP